MLLYSCALFFASFLLVHSATDLQTKCSASSRPHNYTGSSCYILHTEQKQYYAAKLSCNDILGYTGHLIHIRSSIVQAIAEGLLTSNGLLDGWVGIQYNNGTPTTTGVNAGWYYTTTTRKFEDPATFIPWNMGNGILGKVMEFQPNWKITSNPNTKNFSFICEYEEQYAYPITAAATYCNLIPSKNNKTYFAYVEGSCFAVPVPYVIAPAGGKLQNTCPNITGLVTRAAHLNTTGKLNMAQNIGRAICERLGNSEANVDYCYSLIIGLEQLKAGTNNSTGEEARYSWFWTTPEGYKWPANVNLPGFWLPGYPDDVTSERNWATFWVNGAVKDIGYPTDAVLCEYVDPYTFTNFEKACLRSSNPSAVGYSSCFTLNRNTTTFANAKSACTEFPNGYLARINTVEMATFISASLWAKVGLPPSQALFTGLQQFITSGADEPDKQWYWMYPDGTKSLANTTSLPWSSGEPQAAGDCASVTQSGLLKTTACTNSQWSLCQYPHPFMESFTGTANVKGSPANTISESLIGSMAKCRDACQRNGDCTSFAFSKSSGSCQLIRGSSGTVSAPGYMWFKVVQ